MFPEAMNSGSLHFSFVSMVWNGKGGEGGHAGENGYVLWSRRDRTISLWFIYIPVLTVS